MNTKPCDCSEEFLLCACAYGLHVIRLTGYVVSDIAVCISLWLIVEVIGLISDSKNYLLIREI